jgi:streptomycin 6-kinase
VVGWAFAQAVLSAVWSCEDGDDPAWAIATATAARALL